MSKNINFVIKCKFKPSIHSLGVIRRSLHFKIPNCITYRDRENFNVDYTLELFNEVSWNYVHEKSSKLAITVYLIFRSN
jgi:hypothetical protein